MTYILWLISSFRLFICLIISILVVEGVTVHELRYIYLGKFMGGITLK